MAKAPTKSQPAAAPAEAQPKRRKRPARRGLFLVSGAALLAAAGGTGAWFYTAGAPQAAVRPEPTYLALDTFTVNLQSERGREYLQVALSVKLNDEGAGNLLRGRLPEVRNRVLLILAAKRASELTTPQGKDTLAAELGAELKKTVQSDPRAAGIDSVLFTSFVIQ